MRLWRAVPLDRRAAAGEPGGALWFPRAQQGYGRHDNPELYGCLYAAEDAVSAVAEPLAAFRGTGALNPSMLIHLGRPLALAEFELPDDATAIDLDDLRVLVAADLRPSRVATRTRAVTQEMAANLYRADDVAVGLRWWSTIESSWINWTLFDRAAGGVGLVAVAELRLDDTVVRDAAAVLGLTP